MFMQGQLFGHSAYIKGWACCNGGVDDQMTPVVTGRPEGDQHRVANQALRARPEGVAGLVQLSGSGWMGFR